MPQPLREGSLLAGRFEIGERLGGGGTASVHRGRELNADGSLEREVALKILRPELAANEAIREAFLAEADRMERIDAEGVLQVLAFGEEVIQGQSYPWIALELCAGRTLRARVRGDGPLEPEAAAIVLDRILAALEAAHEAGIIHRDLSPGNIMFEAGDEDPASIRILDFGLADATGRPTIGDDVLLAERGQGTHVVGSVEFMSPEQARGLPVRAGSDLYQAGALLYYLTTGSAPFTGESAREVLRAHVHAPPPLISERAPEAQPLDRIVTRAMTKTGARRFRSATEMREALVESAAALPEWRAELHERARRESDADATELLADAPGASAHEIGDGADERPTDFPRPRPIGAIIAIGSLAVVALIALAFVLVPGNRSSTVTGAPPKPTASESPTATETQEMMTPDSDEPTPSPSVAEQRRVPALSGTVADAKRALSAAGFELGDVVPVDGPTGGDTVLGQHPPAGAMAPAGSRVAIEVPSGRNSVPDVSGMRASDAADAIREAGFTVDEGSARKTPNATVTGMTPRPGEVLPLGTRITLVLETAPTNTGTNTPTTTVTASPTPTPTEQL